MPEIRVGQRARLTRRVLGQTEGTKVVVLLYLGDDARLPKYPYRVALVSRPSFIFDASPDELEVIDADS